MPDPVARDFIAAEPGRRAFADITYVDMRKARPYLATVIDGHAGAVFGYTVADHVRTNMRTDIRTDLGCAALDRDACSTRHRKEPSHAPTTTAGACHNGSSKRNDGVMPTGPRDAGWFTTGIS